MKLYHGTSLENAVRIRKEGFRPNCANHSTELLSKIHDYAREKDEYRVLYGKANQRLGFRPALSNRISFVEHFDVARIWAKENRLGTEMQHCLLNVYDAAMEVLPTDLEVEWYQELRKQHAQMHKRLEQFVPVVITADVEDNLVRQGGMKFKVPKDGSYLQSIQEYQLGFPNYKTTSLSLMRYLGYSSLDVRWQSKNKELIQAVSDNPFLIIHEYSTREHVPASCVRKITSVKNL